MKQKLKAGICSIAVAGLFFFANPVHSKDIRTQSDDSKKEELKKSSKKSRSSRKKKSVKKEASKASGVVLAVYQDRGGRATFIPSGWMGDYGDIKLNEGYKVDPKVGESCIQIVYSAQRTNGAGWAGIYWQNPPNNWGNRRGGFNIKDAKKLTFWAKGEKGKERIAEFKVGGITPQTEPGDSDSASIGPIDLTKDWKKYEIDLTGKDLSHIIGGFCYSASADDNPDGFTLYLDEIVFE